MAGCVTAVQFILFSFANYSPSIVMELKVSKEITGKWQNQRSETKKYVSWALFLKSQAARINFEKLLGWTVFKNPNFNPFQSSVLPIRVICCFCSVIHGALSNNHNRKYLRCSCPTLSRTWSVRWIICQHRWSQHGESHDINFVLYMKYTSSDDITIAIYVNI